MRTGDETVLCLRDLQVAYPQDGGYFPVLGGLTLTLGRGEIVSLLGESGSGKSTIAKALTGLLPPSARVGGGTLRLGSDAPLALAGGRVPWETLRGRRIALLYQDARLALNPLRTIGRHFRDVLLHHRLAAASEVRGIASSLLAALQFADPADTLARYPFELSGGMCQRVCIALALCLQPAVLIADEPTSALDTVSQREVLELLEAMRREQGLAVLLITHDIAVANAISDRVVVLHEGGIVEEGATREVLVRPQAAYTRRLLAARTQLAVPQASAETALAAAAETGGPLPGAAAAGPMVAAPGAAGHASAAPGAARDDSAAAGSPARPAAARGTALLEPAPPGRVSSASAARDFAAARSAPRPPAAARDAASPAAAARDSAPLSPADVDPAESHASAARSAARAPALREPVLEIAGLDKSFGRGRPVLHGIDLTLRRGEIVGILGQSGCGKSTLARCIAGLEMPDRGSILLQGAEIGRLRGRRRRDVCRRVQLVFQDARASLNPGRTALQLVQEPLQYLQLGSRQEREREAIFYLGEVGLAGDLLKRRPPELSTGQCQRIAIARALVLRPEVLICDEAVSALDMTVQAQIVSLLQALHVRHGFAMLMISHDIRVLRSLCHSIAVMQQGRFCELGPAQELLRDSRHPYTRLLVSCADEMEVGL